MEPIHMENEFKVGDIVRLTGKMWEDEYPEIANTHVVIEGHEGSGGSDRAYFLHDNYGELYTYRDGEEDWGAELVQRVTVGEPLADWEKDLLVDPSFTEPLDAVLKDIRALLIDKNLAYGNAALDPVRIFSKADAVEQLKVRIDDKLSRLTRGDNAGEDVVTDLLGYLILLKMAERT